MDTENTSTGTAPVVSPTNDGVLVGADARTAPAPASVVPADTRFTADDLAKVREQEKNKLYPEIERLKSDLDVLRKDREERLAAEAARAEADAAAEAERQRQIDEANLNSQQLLEKRQAEFEAQLAAERKAREDAFAMLDHERNYQEFTSWKAERVASARDDIMPELFDLISGNTPEEIEASIAGLTERSNRILESAQAAASAQRRAMVGTRTVGAPASGPLDTTSAQNTANLDLANMSFDDYVKNRSTLLGRAAGNRNSGLFG